MKIVIKNWREHVKKLATQAKEFICPPATQDLELNTKNRDSAIHADHIKYGPLNVDEPGDYWGKIAEYWDTTEDAAKKSLCGNCVAFDISPRMKDCMPGETSDKDGELGYCWMHHFKCHSARSCRTWAKGGPITKDEVSHDWQERNKTSLEEKTKKDACYHKVKSRYKVWPSAYASGALVKCRKVGAKNWGKSKKNEEIEPVTEKKKKAGTESSKESSLKDWFGRKGAKGKQGGWVDCNTCRKDKKTGRKKCKPCGRKEGEQRSKYPACRPTPGACEEKGRSKSWGKKSAKK